MAQPAEAPAEVPAEAPADSAPVAEAAAPEPQYAPPPAPPPAPEAQYAPPPAPEAQYAPPPAAPARKSRAGLVIALVLALLILFAAGGGLAYAMNSAKKAKAEAASAIAAAETAIEDARDFAPDGSDEAATIERAEADLAAAKASVAGGSAFTAKAYLEASALAADASDAADGVLAVLETQLADAESSCGSGDYAGAIDTWKAIIDQYPESRFADEAKTAAVAMVVDDIGVDVDVSTDEALGFAKRVSDLHGGKPPAEVAGFAQDEFLSLAKDEVETLQDLAWANANWAADINRKGTISGDTVYNFQTQDYDASSLKWIQGMQAKVGGLGQKAEMAKLYAALVEATRLCSACKGIADNPSRETATMESFSASQISTVKKNAAAIQAKVDEAKKLIAAIESAS